ncbi:MAG: serine/threonine protein kinase, partial [Deltaproteobacteria bacterium]|nr:serine/threonine protein kinase [Deltaproteobacteria bacterium]
AIKLIRPDMLGDDKERASRLRAQFEREARVTAQLRSPFTIQVYDVGTTENGTFYYVMEYLDGLDIESLVREHGPVEGPRAIYVLKQVCQSLADAHDNRLVHRDIKPANIFLSQMGGTFDYAKVLDFGLARPSEEQDDDGMLTGTPAYLPPETITGEHPVGPASDIYSLGCVAYFMLTGHLVFDEKELVKVAAAHLDRTPLKPSLRTELPIAEPLEELVMRCLAKDPGDRPADGKALLAELVAIDREPWTEEQARDWWTKHGLATDLAA